VKWIGFSEKCQSVSVDWLLRSDIGQVIKTIVGDEKFPDYALPKKPTERKEQRRKKRSR